MFAAGTLVVRISLDYYRILGVPIQATVEQVAQAHHLRVAQHLRSDYSEMALAARRSLLDEAYSVLSNPEQRSSYDRQLLATTYTPDLALNNTSASVDGNSTNSPSGPSIDIQPDRLAGALLILLELGEYEQVVNVGQQRLGNVTARLRSKYLGDTSSGIPDIAMSVALACLELGREHWKNKQYERAAASLEIGHSILEREGVFRSLQASIQTELHNLCPYRVLELLALPEENITERQRGLNLLREMLHQRGGIDGVGDDQSGLSMDDFLKFIQQLRSYLTVAEQQQLFEAEARRPSAVASYLAVYALTARGFAQRQPALIRRARMILYRLAARQDVYLEVAICTMLLGQTEEALISLERSQDLESLRFIQEHSQGSPDWLPGLCLYSEYWLQEEVFPHFRDLMTQQASLKSYFADEQVQIYLEELPHDQDVIALGGIPQSDNVPRLAPDSVVSGYAYAATGSASAERSLPFERHSTHYAAGEFSPGTGSSLSISLPFQGDTSPPHGSRIGSGKESNPSVSQATEASDLNFVAPLNLPRVSPVWGDPATANPQLYDAAPSHSRTVPHGMANVPPTYDSYDSTDQPSNHAPVPVIDGLTREPSVEVPYNPLQNGNLYQPDYPSTTHSTANSTANSTVRRNANTDRDAVGDEPATHAVPVSQPAASPALDMPPDFMATHSGDGRASSAHPSTPLYTGTGGAGSRRQSPRTLRFRRTLLLLLLSALGILGIWALANRVVRFSAREQPDRSPAISQNSPSAGNTPATSPSPGTSPNRTAASPEATTVPSTSALLGAQPLTKEVAKAVVTTWLTVKADAMGDNHNIEKLSTILTEPVLSQWQLQAQDAQTNNVYGRYTHEVLSIGELEISDDEPNQAAIVTEVREAVQFYQDGQVDPGSSYDRTLRVRYTLIHQDEQWRIQAISVLE